MYGVAIQSSGKRIAAVLHASTYHGKVGHRIIKRTVLEEPPLDNPSGWVVSMGDGEGELFKKKLSLFFCCG